MIRPNPARRRRTFILRFGEVYSGVIRSLPCSVPGCHDSRVECAHVVSRGAGGVACHLAPLCVVHHSEHDASARTFENRYRVDMRRIAAHLWHLYRDRDPECREAVERALAKTDLRVDEGAQVTL